MTFTGVDAQTAVVLQYEGGRQSVSFTTLEAMSANRLCINGTDARLEIDSVFYAPTNFTVDHARWQSPNDSRSPHEGQRPSASSRRGRPMPAGRTHREPDSDSRRDLVDHGDPRRGAPPDRLALPLRIGRRLVGRLVDARRHLNDGCGLPHAHEPRVPATPAAPSPMRSSGTTQRSSRLRPVISPPR